MQSGAVNKLLLIKTGTLVGRVDAIVDRLGDMDDIFIREIRCERRDVEVVPVYEGARLTGRPTRYSGILITGSGSMLSSPEQWMIDTIDWLRNATTAGVPVLGVCFGHQMLAHALGGVVGPNPKGLEVGTCDVRAASGYDDDPLLRGLPAMAAFQTHHYETVVCLPRGAQVLASSDIEPHHIIRFAPKVWGVQFHPEFDVDVMHLLVDAFYDRLRAAGLDVELIRRSIRDTSHGRELLGRFYSLSQENGGSP